MPKTAVTAILKQIHALDDEERAQLDRELARRLETEWTAEAKEARKTARRRGIDQEAIDRAIERRRYRR